MTIKKEIEWLTLDAGARKCGEYLDQLVTKIDDCCGEEGFKRNNVDSVRSELAEVRNSQSELQARINTLAKEMCEIRSLVTAARPTTPTEPR